MRSPRPRYVPFLVALLVAAGCAPSTASAATWVVRGAGWGHGVGLSAWGTYGYAKHGSDYREILHHYYADVRITKLDRSPSVRVLLDVRSEGVVFDRATRACGRKLDPTRRYRAERSGSGVRLLSGAGQSLATCGETLRAAGRGPIRVGGLGRYRGGIHVVAAGGSINVVNRLDVNAYVRGSVPAEVPASWPRAALEAMAVAARSIALSTDVGGRGFDLYPDTRTQLYGGVKVESKRTDRAVRETLDEVVTHEGAVAQTVYFSSSGGRTESRFPGGPRVPYLKSVKDPYDYYSPYHRWTARFTQNEIDAKLGGHVEGSLRRIRVTKRGDSPRIETAKLVGSAGTTTIRGDTLQAALGLRSRWAFFEAR
jgi:stage II sporulation protein D